MEGDDVYVFASKAGAPTNPDWFHNLVAHPTVTVELGTETFAARAVVLSRGPTGTGSTPPRPSSSRTSPSTRPAPTGSSRWSGSYAAELTPRGSPTDPAPRAYRRGRDELDRAHGAAGATDRSPAARGRVGPGCSAAPSHRQRAYEARRRADELHVPDDQCLVSVADLGRLHDLLYRLEAAVEDTEGDLHRASGAGAYRQAYEHLLDAARDLVGVVVEPVRR